MTSCLPFGAPEKMVRNIKDGSLFRENAVAVWGCKQRRDTHSRPTVPYFHFLSRTRSIAFISA